MSGRTASSSSQRNSSRRRHAGRKLRAATNQKQHNGDILTANNYQHGEHSSLRAQLTCSTASLAATKSTTVPLECSQMQAVAPRGFSNMEDRPNSETTPGRDSLRYDDAFPAFGKSEEDIGDFYLPPGSMDSAMKAATSSSTASGDADRTMTPQTAGGHSCSDGVRNSEPGSGPRRSAPGTPGTCTRWSGIYPNIASPAVTPLGNPGLHKPQQLEQGQKLGQREESKRNQPGGFPEFAGPANASNAPDDAIDSADGTWRDVDVPSLRDSDATADNTAVAGSIGHVDSENMDMVVGGTPQSVGPTATAAQAQEGQRWLWLSYLQPQLQPYPQQQQHQYQQHLNARPLELGLVEILEALALWLYRNCEHAAVLLLLFILPSAGAAAAASSVVSGSAAASPASAASAIGVSRSRGGIFRRRTDASPPTSSTAATAAFATPTGGADAGTASATAELQPLQAPSLASVGRLCACTLHLALALLIALPPALAARLRSLRAPATAPATTTTSSACAGAYGGAQFFHSSHSAPPLSDLFSLLRALLLLLGLSMPARVSGLPEGLPLGLWGLVRWAVGAYMGLLLWLVLLPWRALRAAVRALAWAGALAGRLATAAKAARAYASAGAGAGAGAGDDVSGDRAPTVSIGGVRCHSLYREGK